MVFCYFNTINLNEIIFNKYYEMVLQKVINKIINIKE